MFGCGTGKKEKKREDGETELPLTRPDLAIVCTQPLPTTPPPSSLARLAGLGLAYLLALLTGYIIQYPISQAAYLLFFYLILFAFVAGLTDLALLTNSLSWRAPLPSVARYVGGTKNELVSSQLVLSWLVSWLVSWLLVREVSELVA